MLWRDMSLLWSEKDVLNLGYKHVAPPEQSIGQWQLETTTWIL